AFTGVVCERINPELPPSATTASSGADVTLAQGQDNEPNPQPTKRVSREWKRNAFFSFQEWVPNWALIISE
uniref:Uncharacterized protein n=1 Tax=Parascaris equorum TaxID=6256 RepID=A0A914RU11_PAREQ